MNRKQLHDAIEKITLSPESDARILAALHEAENRKAPQRRRTKTIRCVVLAAVVVVLLITTVIGAALHPSSKSYTALLGDGVKQWEGKISGEVFATIPLTRFEVEIGDAFFSVDCVSFTATVTATDAIGEEELPTLLPQFMLDFYDSKGIPLCGTQHMYMTELSAPAESARKFAYSFILSGDEIKKNTTMHMACTVYDWVRVEDPSSNIAGYPNGILDSGNCEGRITTVDNTHLTVSVNEAAIERIEITPVKVTCIGTAAVGKDLTSLRSCVQELALVLADGSVITLFNGEVEDPCVIGSGESFLQTGMSFHLCMQAVDVTQITELRCNGRSYAVSAK